MQLRTPSRPSPCQPHQTQLAISLYCACLCPSPLYVGLPEMVMWTQGITQNSPHDPRASIGDGTPSVVLLNCWAGACTTLTGHLIISPGSQEIPLGECIRLALKKEKNQARAIVPCRGVSSLPVTLALESDIVLETADGAG